MDVHGQAELELARCHGNGSDHCCYLPGSGVPDPGGSDQSVCPFLEVDTVPGRHWVCGLRRELGSWEAVHADARFLATVRPVWRANDPPIADCGDWCGPGQCCYAGGV